MIPICIQVIKVVVHNYKNYPDLNNISILKVL